MAPSVLCFWGSRQSYVSRSDSRSRVYPSLTEQNVRLLGCREVAALLHAPGGTRQRRGDSDGFDVLLVLGDKAGFLSFALAFASSRVFFCSSLNAWCSSIALCCASLNA